MIKTVLSTVCAACLLSAMGVASDIVPVQQHLGGGATKHSLQAPGEAIILLKPAYTLSAKLKLPNWFEKALARYTHHKIKIANAIWVKSDSQTFKEIQQFFTQTPFNQIVQKVTPNFIYTLNERTDDPYYNKLWAVENTGQEVNGEKGTPDADADIKEAWDSEKGDHSVIVAVLDTGVDYTHEDLADNMYDELPKHGYDFAGDDDGNNDDDPMPDQPYDKNGHYHGTHVAGTIGAVGNNGVGVSGVNQNVQILAVKVFRPKGYAYSNDILEGMDFVSDRIDQGDHIVAINASYGGGGKDDATKRAIENLGKKGVVFCAAAGNDGSDNDSDPQYPASYDVDTLIAVAATDQNDQLTSWSNYGKKSVDVAAPGNNILSTYPGNKYAYLAGTSMATPHVTGEVALLAAHNPDATVKELIKAVKYGVDPKESLRDKVATGGRINVAKAIAYIENPDQNHAPVAQDDSAETDENRAVSIDVLANDSDPDGDTLQIASVGKPQHGTVRISENGVEYTPDKDYTGDDTFSYTVTDGELNSSANVKVTVKKADFFGDFFGGIFSGLF
jgi:subtilisin family serine protease